MSKTMKSFLIILIATGLAAAVARAESVTITFDHPNQTGNPGETLQFFGSIVNTDPNAGDEPIYLNLDNLTLTLGDALEADLFFINVPISLPAGASSGSIELFDFTLATPETDPFGVYSGTYTLLGGMDGGADTAQDILGQAGFSIDAEPAISAPVPEPGTLSLLGTGVALTYLLDCRRRIKEGGCSPALQKLP